MKDAILWHEIKENEMGYIDKVYDENYDRTISYWFDRLDQGPVEKVLAELKGDLQTLYVRMDNDHEGRGELGDATISAQIAALEVARVEGDRQSSQGGSSRLQPGRE